MSQHMVIRDETDADVSVITAVAIAAFKTVEISNKTEQYIIEALRAARARTVWSQSWMVVWWGTLPSPP